MKNFSPVGELNFFTLTWEISTRAEIFSRYSYHFVWLKTQSLYIAWVCLPKFSFQPGSWSSILITQPFYHQLHFTSICFGAPSNSPCNHPLNEWLLVGRAVVSIVLKSVMKLLHMCFYTPRDTNLVSWDSSIEDKTTSYKIN